jgi:hypothetical protein
MSEFMMLATSRSPAQWMTQQLAVAGESEDGANEGRNGSGLVDRDAMQALFVFVGVAPG